jgi:hypothetical protein
VLPSRQDWRSSNNPRTDPGAKQTPAYTLTAGGLFHPATSISPSILAASVNVPGTGRCFLSRTGIILRPGAEVKTSGLEAHFSPGADRHLPSQQRLEWNRSQVRDGLVLGGLGRGEGLPSLPDWDILSRELEEGG